MVFFPDDEIKRKSFHLLTLIYIFAYWFLPRGFVLWGMAAATFLAASIEVIRLNFPSFNKWILGFLNGVHRDEEYSHMSGLPWTLSGSFLTMLLFNDKRIVLASLFYLSLGDTFAALVGRKVGKNRILNGKKTFEGSAACFLVCLVFGLFFLEWQLAFIGALAATVIEVISGRLSDNFLVPLLSAAVLSLIIPYF
jgi:dolichol kinase